MIKKALFILLLCLTWFSWAFASDCPRRCAVFMYADGQHMAGLHEVLNAFRQTAKTEYFSFVDSGNFEYLLSVEFDVFDEDVYRSGFETDEQGRSRIVKKGPFRSHFIIGLWFVAGKPRDRGPGNRGFNHEYNYYVRDWESWSVDRSPLGHKNALLSQIQVTPPLHEIAWDYEGMPVTIEIEPDKDCAEFDEKVRIDMKSSRDRKGKNAQPFGGSGCDNRFVFTTEHGKMLLSDENKTGEKEWASSAGYLYFDYQAPSPEECGDCGEDTISVFNSCDVLDPDVHSYSRTSKREKIYELKIDIGCDWEGTILSTSTLAPGADASLLGELMRSYQGVTHWKLDVIFEMDRGNERTRIYRLKSARFDFSDQLDGDFVLEGEAGKVQITGEDRAETSGRSLRPSECSLELIIDLKKKTYKIEGLLDVQGIAEQGEGDLKVDAPPIRHDEKDIDESMRDYKEEIHIGGEFKEESPDKLEGNVDEIKELPPGFVEFLEAWAGKVTGKIRWKLEKKGKRK